MNIWIFGKKQKNVFTNNIRNFIETILSNYHVFYVQSNNLMLMENFKNFRGICFDKYSLDPVHFYSALGLEFLIHMDTLLMIVSEVRESIRHSVLRHDKANNKYLKNQNKN